MPGMKAAPHLIGRLEKRKASQKIRIRPKATILAAVFSTDFARVFAKSTRIHRCFHAMPSEFNSDCMSTFAR